jgi:hypothetical protein
VWILCDVCSGHDQRVERHLRNLSASQSSNQHVTGFVHYLHGEPRKADERYDQQDLRDALHHS